MSLSDMAEPRRPPSIAAMVTAHRPLPSSMRRSSRCRVLPRRLNSFSDRQTIIVFLTPGWTFRPGVFAFGLPEERFLPAALTKLCIITKLVESVI
ncbi:hypothetical protein AGR4C_Cc80520 [Agrobacterium tumefaciens str. Kerr 14]|uniref:Uncharacterized protein n=1 Tax=Agrobacterium tumefaciens str. Kerr 14 TaxID=1183424 RepID=A0A1S7QTF5_AGRTU|nr:hypothetical protein AGR4C_Cc80520 [Agrobacterium tumefaciens str. Kerr 14]